MRHSHASLVGFQIHGTTYCFFSALNTPPVEGSAYFRMALQSSFLIENRKIEAFCCCHISYCIFNSLTRSSVSASMSASLSRGPVGGHNWGIAMQSVHESLGLDRPTVDRTTTQQAKQARQIASTAYILHVGGFLFRVYYW